LFELTDGEVIDLATIPGDFLTIRANTNTTDIGSILLRLSGALTKNRGESFAPYALYGDADGNYFGAVFPEGQYMLRATIYSGPGLSGTIGESGEY